MGKHSKEEVPVFKCKKCCELVKGGRVENRDLCGRCRHLALLQQWERMMVAKLEKEVGNDVSEQTKRLKVEIAKMAREGVKDKVTEKAVEFGVDSGEELEVVGSGGSGSGGSGSGSSTDYLYVPDEVIESSGDDGRKESRKKKLKRSILRKRRSVSKTGGDGAGSVGESGEVSVRVEESILVGGVGGAGSVGESGVDGAGNVGERGEVSVREEEIILVAGVSGAGSVREGGVGGAGSVGVGGEVRVVEGGDDKKVGGGDKEEEMKKPIRIKFHYKGDRHYYPGSPFYDGMDKVVGLDDEEKVILSKRIDRAKREIEQKLAQYFGSVRAVEVEIINHRVRYCLGCPVSNCLFPRKVVGQTPDVGAT